MIDFLVANRIGVPKGARTPMEDVDEHRDDYAQALVAGF